MPPKLAHGLEIKSVYIVCHFPDRILYRHTLDRKGVLCRLLL